MSLGRRDSRALPRAAAPGAVALLMTLSIGAPGHAGAAPAAPLAGTVQTGTAAWAVVPMGKLSDPANTFWQVLREGPGSTQWSVVTPPGVADNGGVVLGASEGSVAVGFLPSGLLRFSPLSVSANAGTTWSPAYLPGALSARPGALAVGPGHSGALAVVGNTVLRSPPGLSSWTPLVTLSTLRRVTGSPRCRPGALDAVSFSSADAPLLATSCTRKGVVGLFTRSSGHWLDEGVALPGRLRASTTTVLALSSSGSGSIALVAARAAGHTDLVALWQSPGGWRASAPHSLRSGAAVRSTATAAGGAITVLTDSRGHETVDQIFPSGSWNTLPSAPAGTVAVASNMPVATTDAPTAESFVVDGSVLRVFEPTPAGSKWLPVQTLQVSLAFGSSG